MVLKPVAAIFVAVITLGALGYAQAPIKYEPTIESLDKHPLPQWYAGAKLGIFIHWGLYSVPGWAPLSHPDHDFSSNDYIKYDPYAEWYLNILAHPRLAHAGLSAGALRSELQLLRFRTRPSIANRKSGIPTRWPRSSVTPARATWSSPASTTKASRFGRAPLPIPAQASSQASYTLNATSLAN